MSVKTSVCRKSGSKPFFYFILFAIGSKPAPLQRLVFTLIDISRNVLKRTFFQLDINGVWVGGNDEVKEGSWR